MGLDEDVNDWIRNQRIPGRMLKRKEENYVSTAKLEVNWFRLLGNIENYEVNVYTLSFYRQQFDKWPPLNGREHKRVVFWEMVRKHFPREVGTFVFDGLVTLYRKYPLDVGDFPRRTVKGRNHSFEVEVEFDEVFYRIKFVRENPMRIDYDTGAKFVKALFSQGIRYAPGPGEERIRDMIRGFTHSKNTIFRVPTNPECPKVVITEDMSAFIGLFAGLRQMQNGRPALNLGLVHKIFYNKRDMNLLEFVLLHLKEGASIDLIQQYLAELRAGKYVLNNLNRKEFEKMISGLKVKTDCAYDPETKSFQQRHLRVQYLHNKTARDYPKMHPNLERIYADHGIPLVSPTLPLVVCRTGTKFFYLPMCTLQIRNHSEAYKGIIEARMLDSFIKGATREPHEHQNITMELIKMLGPTIQGEEGKNFMRAFGFAFDPQLVSVEGHRLRAPNLLNKHGLPVEVKEERFFAEKTVNEMTQKRLKFAYCVLQNRENKSCVPYSQMQKFHIGLIDAAIIRQMNVEETGPEELRSAFNIYQNLPLNGRNNFEMAVDDAISRFPNHDTEQLFFIVIVDDSSDTEYGYIKNVIEYERGFPSQVIKASTVKKRVRGESKTTVNYNLVLKINAKAGGVNQEIDYVKNSEMTVEEKERRKHEPITQYIGIDFAHSTPSFLLQSSVASIVMSVDRTGVKYKDYTAPVKNRAERVGAPKYGEKKREDTYMSLFAKELRESVVKLIHLFRDNEGRYPDNVVIFRDGVSDSQMHLTASDEICALVECYQLALAGTDQPLPKFSYIVVQKRHSTRFYELGGTECTGQNPKGIINIKSGTVIDRDVISPNRYEFYLASHHGELGTTRPAHFTVMVDQQKMHPDDVKEMCYKMSFLSARCRKPISIPVPVHYAHLCCEKFKELYANSLSNLNLNYHELVDYVKSSKLGQHPGMPFA